MAKNRIPTPIAFYNNRVSIGNAATVCESDNGVAMGPGAAVGGNSSTPPNPDLSPRSCAIGSDAKVIDQSPQSVSVGVTAFVGHSSENSVALGLSASVRSSPNSVVVGEQSLALNGSYGSVCLGYQAQASINGFNTVVVGYAASANDGSLRAVVLGEQATVTDNSTDSTCLGRLATITGTPSAVVIGTRAACLSGGDRTVVIGRDASSAAAHSVVIGDAATLTNNAGSYNLLAGTSANNTGPNQYTIIIGVRATLTGEYSDHAIGIGFEVSVTSDNSDRVVVIGSQAKSTGGSFGCLVVGDNAIAGQGSFAAIAIGHQASVTNATPGAASYAIAIGNLSTTQSPGSILVSSLTSAIDELSGRAVGIGSQITITASPSGFALGQNLVLLNTSTSTLIGQNSSITKAGYSLAMGYGNSITDALAGGASNDNSHLAIGSVNTMGDNTDGSSIIGVANSITGQHSWAIGHTNLIASDQIRAIGCDILCNTIPQYNVFMFGQSVDATVGDASFGFTMGTGATAVANQFNIGHSTFLPLGASAIRTFTVRGYNGGAIETIQATDSPAASGEVGLKLPFNTGAGVVGKNIFGAVSPPVGSLLLHVSP
jgi:hypothetical protein